MMMMLLIVLKQYESLSHTHDTICNFIPENHHVQGTDVVCYTCTLHMVVKGYLVRLINFTISRLACI